MRVRLALLLLAAGLLLPGAAAAQSTREFGAFAGAQGFGPAGPNAQGFNNLAGPYGGPPPMAPGASFGNGGGGMQVHGWNAEPPGIAGAARFGQQQAFGGADRTS
ncbi:hypothetical protein QRQ56_06585 [Bradyrhizobium sp. U531]|uniref:hypothetical protein n=1 Tax=Bradyrhizobium sp. U531 TaxID=3053458 RepID=UPI003F42EFE3